MKKSNNVKNGKPFPAKHRKALQKFYDKHGVGKTAKQRHAFWNSYQPNTNISHVDPDDNVVRTKVFELCWLTDNFPKDFILC